MTIFTSNSYCKSIILNCNSTSIKFEALPLIDNFRIGNFIYSSPKYCIKQCKNIVHIVSLQFYLCINVPASAFCVACTSFIQRTLATSLFNSCDSLHLAGTAGIIIFSDIIVSVFHYFVQNIQTLFNGYCKDKVVYPV